jgi:hypothetical protein
VKAVTKEGMREEKQKAGERADRSSTSSWHGVLLSAAHTRWQGAAPCTVPSGSSLRGCRAGATGLQSRLSHSLGLLGEVFATTPKWRTASC